LISKFGQALAGNFDEVNFQQVPQFIHSAVRFSRLSSSLDRWAALRAVQPAAGAEVVARSFLLSRLLSTLYKLAA
jgi:hypothetical protein